MSIEKLYCTRLNYEVPVKFHNEMPLKIMCNEYDSKDKSCKKQNKKNPQYETPEGQPCIFQKWMEL